MLTQRRRHNYSKTSWDPVTWPPKRPKINKKVAPLSLGAASVWRPPSAAPRRSSTLRPARSLAAEPAPAAATPPSKGSPINGRHSHPAASALYTCDLATCARRPPALHPPRYAVALPRPSPLGARARSGCRPGLFEAFCVAPRKAKVAPRKAISFACCGVSSGGGAGGEAGDALGDGWCGGGAPAASAGERGGAIVCVSERVREGGGAPQLCAVGQRALTLTSRLPSNMVA